MVLKKNWLLIVFAFCIFIVALSVFALWSFTPRWSRCKDCRIVSAIVQARAVMTYIGGNDGNYDNFNCEHEEMVVLCQEIDKNYRKEDGKEPIITHDTPNNSQAACIYSPLRYRENSWYCLDSEGYPGETSTNPGSPGYCVEGKSAVCPPLREDIP